MLSTALIVSGGSSRLTAEASTSVAQITINAETQQHQDDAEPHNATNPDAEAPEESVNVTTPFQVSSAAHPTSHGSTEQTVAQPTAAAARQPQNSADLDNIAHSDPVVLEASKPAKASVQASAAAGLTPKCSIAEPASQPVAANSAINASRDEPMVLRSAEEHDACSVTELSRNLLTAKLTKLSSPADGLAEVKCAKYSTASLRRALQSYREAKEQVRSRHFASVMGLT